MLHYEANAQMYRAGTETDSSLGISLIKKSQGTEEGRYYYTRPPRYCPHKTDSTSQFSALKDAEESQAGQGLEMRTRREDL